jgi:hypothetical protein
MQALLSHGPPFRLDLADLIVGKDIFDDPITASHLLCLIDSQAHQLLKSQIHRPTLPPHLRSEPLEVATLTDGGWWSNGNWWTMENVDLVRFPYFVGFAWLQRWWGFCIWRRNLWVLLGYRWWGFCVWRRNFWVLDDENGSGFG